MLEIEVHEIRGYCPVYKVGDKIVIDDPEIVLEKTDAQTLGKFDQNASQQTKPLQGLRGQRGGAPLFRKSLIKNINNLVKIGVIGWL